MLSKKYRLSKKDFIAAFKGKGLFVKGESLDVKIIKNSLELTRFGISCGTKISKKAVVRNFLKRRVSEIIRMNLPKIKKGFDVIVLLHPEIKGKTFQEIEKTTLNIFKKAKLMN